MTSRNDLSKWALEMPSKKGFHNWGCVILLLIPADMPCAASHSDFWTNLGCMPKHLLASVIEKNIAPPLSVHIGSSTEVSANSIVKSSGRRVEASISVM